MNCHNVSYENEWTLDISKPKLKLNNGNQSKNDKFMTQVKNYNKHSFIQHSRTL